MPRVGFEPTIPVFEMAKTVHALDRVVTVIAEMVTTMQYYSSNCSFRTTYSLTMRLKVVSCREVSCWIYPVMVWCQ
jgi:hypothetical protein